MPTLSEIKQRVDGLRRELQAEAEEQAALIAGSLHVLILNRIFIGGENEEGGTFGQYSTTPLPVYWFERRVLNQSGYDNLVKKSKKNPNKDLRGLASYYQFRQSQGLTNKDVNFFFSGQLRNGVNWEVVRGANGYLIRIAPTTEYANRVLGYLTLRFGEIIVLSQKEKDIGIAAYQDWLISKFRKYNLDFNLK